MERSRKVRLTAALAALLAVGVTGTMALFSDSATTDISVTSAKFDLEVNGSSTGTYSVSIDATNISPGENRVGDIVLKNNSTVPATVSLASNGLSGFTSSVTGAAAAPFTSVVIPAGGSEELDLTIGLPIATTVAPADQTLTLTFTADQ